MCINVQPVCNACGAIAAPMKLHECIFCDCKYIEECTRFLTSFELLDWDCHIPNCGLNMDTINNKLAEIDQMLRMEISLPIRPAEGNLEANRKPGPISRGFDGDGISHSQATTGATELKALPEDAIPTTTPLSVTVPAALVDIPPRPLSAPTPESTLHDQVSLKNSVTANENVASSDNTAAEEDAAAADNNVAANDSFATKDNVAVNTSIQTEFDPDSVHLNTFPKCRSCFKGRRRCNGQTPCDKCQQRGSSRACRPVTVELLREYPARAERILELAGRN